MKEDTKAKESSEAAPAPKKSEAAAEAEKAEPKPNNKITMYLRFSNVKSLDSRCQVELQVWLSLQCDWPMNENA